MDVNHDRDPFRYLVVYGDDHKFALSLTDLDKTDSNFDETNSSMSNQVMVQYLNILLSQKVHEIEERIALIQARDVELQRLIDEIHRIYASKRYRLGHMIIRPIESLISSVRRK